MLRPHLSRSPSPRFLSFRELLHTQWMGYLGKQKNARFAICKMEHNIHTRHARFTRFFGPFLSNAAVNISVCFGCSWLWGRARLVHCFCISQSSHILIVLYCVPTSTMSFVCIFECAHNRQKKNSFLESKWQMRSVTSWTNRWGRALRREMYGNVLCCVYKCAADTRHICWVPEYVLCWIVIAMLSRWMWTIASSTARTHFCIILSFPNGKSWEFTAWLFATYELKNLATTMVNRR